MSELPAIDPSWTRRRALPVEDHSLRYVIVVSAILLLLILWIARAESARQAELRDSVARVNAANLAAFQRRVSAEQLQRSIARAARRQPQYAGPVSSGGASTFWIERSPSRASSARERAAQDLWVRQQAEARLRAEEARFAQLTGQNQTYRQPGISTSTPNNGALCAQAKADRDNAYRLVGNNRTLDFIRHWNDIVYEACKHT